MFRDTHLLLITLTFDQKRIAKQDAWQSITSRGKAFNRFSAVISKVFGTKATWKIKEGTASGYPAPHILVFVDRPVRAFNHKKSWRLQSQEKLERLRKAWPYGFIDVEAVVSNKVGKRNIYSILSDQVPNRDHYPQGQQGEPSEEGELKAERMALQTHIWNKLLSVGTCFPRRSTRLNQLQPLKSELTKECGPCYQSSMWSAH